MHPCHRSVHVGDQNLEFYNVKRRYLGYLWTPLQKENCMSIFPVIIPSIHPLRFFSQNIVYLGILQPSGGQTTVTGISLLHWNGDHGTISQSMIFLPRSL